MTTLTSTGAVNLTSSTNWSPSQTPVDGDDLVIGAHTLTLDADLTLNSITFNSGGNGRLVCSGVDRVVNVTNGFTVNSSFSAVTLVAAVTAGQNLTLRGTWRGTTSFLNAICSSTGGNVTLATIGDDPSEVLVEGFTTAAFSFTSSWSAGTLTTTGRLNLPLWVPGTTIVTMSGGTWNHTHTGTSYFGTGSHRILSQTGTATGSWTGDVESASTLTSAGLFTFVGSGNWAITGNALLTNTAGSAGSRTSVVDFVNYTGTVTMTGKPCCRGKALSIYGQLGGAGRINWRNQSVAVAADENIVIYMPGLGTLDLTDLDVTNAGKFIVLVSSGATSVVTGTSTLITNTTTAAQAAVYTAAGELDGKVINLASDAPTLPAAEDVAAGSGNYGYSISPITPTGLVVDPALFASAVGTALENISATALARFVTVDTGETSAAAGSVASFGGSVGGETKEDIYTYFTTDDREDAFKATGFATPEDVSPTINFSPTIEPTELSSGSIDEIKAAIIHEDDLGNKLRISAAGKVDAELDTAYLFDDGFGRKAINANVTHYQETLQGNGDLPAKLDAIRTNTNVDIPALINDLPTNSELDTALAAADDAVLAAISALNNLSAAQVNAELLDVLNTDTFAELAAPPAASSTLAAKLTWLFMWARNKATQSATERKLYADDGTTVVSTETVSDVSGTFTKGEAS